MSDVTLTATRSFHAGGIGTIAEGQEFSASENRARELEQAGLAERSGGAKSDPAPLNKADPPVENKAEDETERRPAGRPRKVKVEESDNAVPE